LLNYLSLSRIIGVLLDYYANAKISLESRK
jgi:hypothetical protein